jgi:hypothetical protein
MASSARKSKPVQCDSEIQLKTGAVSRCSSYKYLGFWLTEDWDFEINLTHRRISGNSALTQVKHVLKSPKLSLKRRLALANTYVLSSLSYGCELWTSPAAWMNKLDSFGRRILRHAVRRWWPDNPISNAQLQEMFQLPSLSVRFKQRRARYVGHIVRMNPNRLTRRCFFAAVDNTTRHRGQIRQTWRKTVARDLKNRVPKDCTERLWWKRSISSMTD